ncbi:CpsB/CapC family capsule biosynthesis tyrosine phosphatase [Gaiella sp.]|uniref:CpsB/CapC family capsule biosynthesis tyrosine phosphatase n=1 Tax=Gaiella sp. TaxID=2663207 RepID=UPI0032642F9F
MRGFIDVHSHVVPSCDDGAEGIEEGLALCRIAFETGTDVLFATPHAHAPWDTFPRSPRRDAVYAAALPVMQKEAATWGLDLRRGWEVYPTVIAPENVEEYSLEGTRGVLIEFPGFWLDLDDAVAIVCEAAMIVESAGLLPILAHPERCRAVADDPGCVRALVERGWLLCANAPSFLGGHGQTAERTAWALLDAELIALVASDGHTRGRPPVMDDAYAAVCERRGEAAARPLFTGSAIPWC